MSSTTTVSAAIPLEVIDCILDHVDNACLVQLCRTTRNFRTAALPRLVRQFLSGIHVRLWIEQRDVVGHLAMDFCWESISEVNDRLVFVPSAAQEALSCFSASHASPPVIDGITMVLPPTKTDMHRRVESIAYSMDERIPATLIDDCTQQGRCRTAKHPSWTLHYTTWTSKKDRSQHALCPISFECDWSLPLRMSLKSSAASS